MKSNAIDLIIRIISSVTGRPPHEIDLEVPFLQMGIESLQAVHIIDLLSKELKREISPALMFDFPTVLALAKYLDTPAPLNFIHSKIVSESYQAPAAIIGMACNFPGAKNLKEFWALIKNGKFSIQKASNDRPELNILSSGGSHHYPWMGQIEGEDYFDHETFGMTPLEASRMDPQQRLLLMAAWHAIEDASLTPSELSGSKTGVFIGISASDYSLVTGQNKDKNVFDATGNAHSIAANRISYQFNLKGPSVAVDTACSSSLVAFHLAIQSLRAGEIDYALVGGVNLIFNPDLTMAFASAGMLSPDGKCKTFSEEANGYVRGEGVGVVLLKRLDDAINDDDRIYAQILGSAVNQDGLTNGLTAPNGIAQEEVIQSALRSAHLNPEDIELIEAHGTGTALGDPIEYLSLHRVFKNHPGKIHLGSIKTNIGHLEAAAGVAGLIKTALAIHHRWIPAMLHFTKLNSKIGDFDSPLSPTTSGLDWSSTSRKAGISSFGFGGTNAHILLGEVPERRSNNETLTDAPYISIDFSTPTMKELPDTAKEWLHYLEDLQIVPSFPLRRLEMREKHIILGKTIEDIKQTLIKISQNEKSSDLITIHSGKKNQKKIVFLFTGQGSQYSSMGSEFYKSEPIFRSHFENCCEEFNRYLNEELSEIIFQADKSHLLEQTDYAQAAIFTIDFCLAMTLKEKYGIEPDYLIGHSLGEIAAAAFSGALTLSQAARMVSIRGALMQSTSPGAMLNVTASKEEVEALIHGKQISVEIAAANAPQNIVLSGSKNDIDKTELFFKERGTRITRLKVTKAFHSVLMDPVLEEFEKSIEGIQFQQPKYKIVSGLTGKIMTGLYTSQYWREHARRPTLFQQGIDTLIHLGANIFIETGPHPTLSSLGQFCNNDSRMTWLTTFKRNSSEVYEWYRLIAHLHGHGLIKNHNNKRCFPPPPLSPFQKNKYWLGERNKVFSIQQEKKKMNINNQIIDELRSMVATLLHVSAHEVNVDESLLDSGADSLLLLNAVQNIKDQYQVDIAISDVFHDLSTIRKIAEHIELKKPRFETVMPSQSTNIGQPQAMSWPNQMPQMPMMPFMYVIPMHPQMFTQMPEFQQQMMNGWMQMQQQTWPGVTQTQAAPQTLPPSQAQETKGVLGMFRTEAVKTVDGQEVSRTEPYFKKLKAAFNQRTAKSKTQTQNYRKVLADNRVSAGFRPNTKEVVYPIIFKDASGSRFHDLDGNQYIDFTMGFGVNLFGHNPKFIVDKVREQLDLGMAVGPQSSLAGPVAQLITELTGQDRVAFVNSGTEAVMTAIRLARAVTKRDKIVIFNGSYHGHFDGVLSRPSKDKSGVPVAPGIVQSFSRDVIVLEYGDNESLEHIKRIGHEIAAVLVEPVQSRFPEQRPGDFLKNLRTITSSTGAALIFDEVITGFRIHTGGAQAHFGVKADIASYGKILGGGLPIGAIAGAEKFMNPIDGGYWEFGDSSYPSAEMTFFAGTFCKHPLAMAAAQAVLEKLKVQGNEILNELNQRTDEIRIGLNQFFNQHEVDLQVNNFGSLFRFKSGSNIDFFFSELNLRGIYVWEGRNMFLSTAHTDKDIDTFIKTVQAITLDLIKEGILRKKSLR